MRGCVSACMEAWMRGYADSLVIRVSERQRECIGARVCGCVGWVRECACFWGSGECT